MVIDVTDTTFEQDVLVRSDSAAVVVDLWAPWCGPCRTLGPILEQVIGETAGAVVLAKVNVDENPGIAQAFRVQGIPAVYAISRGQVVDHFVGAQGEAEVRAFVQALLPTAEESEIDRLVAAGDEASLRAALELDHGYEPARRSGRQRGGARTPRPHPRECGDPADRRARAHRPGGRRRGNNAARSPRPGEGRRRGTSAVRGPARGARPRRPADGAVPQAADLAPVLTAPGQAQKNVKLIDTELRNG